MNPTPSEQFVIARRRDGDTIPMAALFFGVSSATYSKWERGEPTRERMPEPPDVGPLTLAERLFLRRVRAGLTLREVADRLSLSVKAVHEMEHGKRDPAALAAWFEESA